ncbi:ALK and LTK ligand 2b [Synchiropus picturatus]
MVPRLPVLSVLLLLLLAAGRCSAAALLKSTGARAEGRMDSRSVLELVGRYSRGRVETELELTRHGEQNSEKERRTNPGLEHQHQGARKKEKFIKHLTGSLNFNPRCRKHFRRLFNNTRDCSVPAYYKRCARLLIRLAKSPHCSGR